MVDGQDIITLQVHLEHYFTGNILSLFQKSMPGDVLS